MTGLTFVNGHNPHVRWGIEVWGGVKHKIYDISVSVNFMKKMQLNQNLELYVLTSMFRTGTPLKIIMMHSILIRLVMVLLSYGE